MKCSLTLDNFPMQLFEMFEKDLAKYVNATVQVGGQDTVFVTFTTDDISKAQCGVIVCDKYAFGGGCGDGEILCEDGE